MTDRIVLAGMRFEGRHGVGEEERALPQEIEVDVEIELALAAAGRTDDLERTVDYGPVIAACRRIVEQRSFQLLEGIAEAIAADVLSDAAADAVVVRVRKPGVPVDVDLDSAGVEIRRARPSPGPT